MKEFTKEQLSKMDDDKDTLVYELSKTVNKSNDSISLALIKAVVDVTYDETVKAKTNLLGEKDTDETAFKIVAEIIMELECLKVRISNKINKLDGRI